MTRLHSTPIDVGRRKAISTNMRLYRDHIGLGGHVDVQCSFGFQRHRPAAFASLRTFFEKRLRAPCMKEKPQLEGQAGQRQREPRLQQLASQRHQNTQSRSGKLPHLLQVNHRHQATQHANRFTASCNAGAAAAPICLAHRCASPPAYGRRPPSTGQDRGAGSRPPTAPWEAAGQARQVTHVARCKTRGAPARSASPTRSHIAASIACAAYVANQDVEAAANTHGHRHAQPLAVHPNPLFLLGISESHQQNIRPGRVNPVQDLTVIHPGQALLGRGICAHDMNARIIAFQQLRRLSATPARPPSKKDPVALARGKRGQFGHQVTPVTRSGSAWPQQPGSPHQRHSVRQHQAASGNDPVQMRIVLRVEPDVQIDGGNLMGPAR